MRILQRGTDAMETITLTRFLNHFCIDKDKAKKFCFILGAGASRPSGIPTGAELAKQWLGEMQQLAEELGEENIHKQWLEVNEITPENSAQHYSLIYQKRFELFKREGFAFLEKLMEKVEPSCGYSVLAQVLTQKPHKIVITTNFDSLTEDALFIYTNTKPLVIGHESLADFLIKDGTRPTIVKIHRDLLLNPKNTEADTSNMPDKFKDNLKGVFETHIPLVIGYGGNDGSLMKYLEELDPMPEGLFWFYRKGNGLSTRIQSLIEKHNGWAVEILGFDELMIQISKKLKLEMLHKEIVEIARKRAITYREKFEEIASKSDDATKEALTEITGRGEKDWWYYEIVARAEEDIDKRDQIYRKGLEACPNSPELHGSYAIFLWKICNEHDRAETHYKKALELDPKNAICHGGYAVFLTDIRQDYDRAEDYYKQALEAEPNHATNLGNYATFLTDIRHKQDQAEEYFKKALDADPDSVNKLGNYALFLKIIRGDYDQAETFYKKALEADPDDANYLGYYAAFLSDIRQDFGQADKYFKKTLNIDPKNANSLGNYAKHLIVQNKNEQARSFIERSFAFNKSVPHNNGLDLELWFYRYAVFHGEYPETADKIDELLEQGVRSLYWDLTKVLEVAKELGHPDYKRLVEFAERISKPKE